MALKEFLFNVSESPNELREITEQHKDNPRLAVERILEVAQRQSLTFTDQEFISAVAEFVEVRREQLRPRTGHTTLTLTFGETELRDLPAPTGLVYDGVIYNALILLDFDYLSQIASLKQ
jgi:hypothetical protein